MSYARSSALSLIRVAGQVGLWRMVGILTTSLPWIGNIYAVLLLLMYTFAVLGMEFFGSSMPDVDAASDNGIAFNYNSFGKAFITLLSLLTGNLWNEILSETVGSTGHQAAIIFYVVWLVLSRWLVVAMVVTVIFHRINIDTEEHLKVAAKKSMNSVFALERALMQCHKSHAFIRWRRCYEEDTGNRAFTKGKIRLMEYSPPPARPGFWKRMQDSPRSILLFAPQNPIRELCVWLTEPALAAMSSKKNNRAPGARPAKLSSAHIGYNSLGKRSRWEIFLGRQGLHKWARHAVESITLIGVVASLVVVTLDAETYTGRRAATDFALARRVCEALAMTIFLLELVVLNIARGFIWLPGAYLSDPLNALDLGVTVLWLLCLLAFSGSRWEDSAAVAAVKAFRALKAVRLVKLADGTPLARVLKAIRASGRALVMAGLVVVFFLVQWAVVGLQVCTHGPLLAAERLGALCERGGYRGRSVEGRESLDDRNRQEIKRGCRSSCCRLDAVRGHAKAAL